MNIDKDMFIHPQTRLSNAQLGTICFLLSHFLLFAALFSVALALRIANPDFASCPTYLSSLLGTLGLICMLFIAKGSLSLEKNIRLKKKTTLNRWDAIILSSCLLFFFVFLTDYYIRVKQGYAPNNTIGDATYYAMTSVFLIHIVLGALAHLHFRLKNLNGQAAHDIAQCMKLFWVFLTFCWIGVYSIIYVL